MGAMHFGLDSYLSLEPSSLCPPVYMQNDNSELIIRSKQKHKEAFGLAMEVLRRMGEEQPRGMAIDLASLQ